jgi:hypothetical protein
MELLAQPCTGQHRNRRSQFRPELKTNQMRARPTKPPQRGKERASAATHLTAADRKFLMDAAADGMKEVELGRVAQGARDEPRRQKLRKRSDQNSASRQKGSSDNKPAAKDPVRNP